MFVQRLILPLYSVSKEVFTHYTELENRGLAALQIKYIMNDLKEKGKKVGSRVTTGSEAKEEILKALREAGSPLLKGGQEK